ncbi:hypothetical protein PanWU01x14_303470 [Parasponia andersonii]|uniref:Uncharacterized protein n=1 Tax=Parasponia andersonii TaxID=3476 RepID=A0A2P5ASX8_PARAD|nr:hypothetical protein PanWU01x14_303470 [Parasponia andersonii]
MAPKTEVVFVPAAALSQVSSKATERCPKKQPVSKFFKSIIRILTRASIVSTYDKVLHSMKESENRLKELEDKVALLEVKISMLESEKSALTDEKRKLKDTISHYTDALVKARRVTMLEFKTSSLPDHEGKAMDQGISTITCNIYYEHLAFDFNILGPDMVALADS